MTYWNPPDPTQQQPYEAPRPPRRRRLLWGVGAGVVAAGGIVGGVLAATSGASTSAAAAPLPTTTVPASPSAPAPHHHRARHAVRGTVASEHGDTWTLKTPKGQTVTVTITAQTAWGTKAKPAAESQFVTGDQVIVVGSRAGGTVTAKRVAAQPAAPPPATT